MIRISDILLKNKYGSERKKSIILSGKQEVKEMKWIKKNWLSIVAIVITLYIGLYPTRFSAMGNALEDYLRGLYLTYCTWSNLSTVIIILLLIVILVKQQKQSQ